jgi:hypothetical protein
MVILFFKAIGQVDSDKEATADKMRRILESHGEAAETGEERERAELDPSKFRVASSGPRRSNHG